MSISYHLRATIVPYWKLWITIGGMILILFYIQQFNLEELGRNIIQSWWILLIMLPVSGMAYLSATIAWKYTLNDSRVPLSSLFVVRHIGESLALINPTNIIAGDLSKVLVLKKYNVDQRQALTSVIISRVLIIISGILLSCLSFVLWIILFLPYENLFLLTLWPIIGIFMVYAMWRIVTNRKLFLYGLTKYLVYPFAENSRIKKMLIRLKIVNAMIVLQSHQQQKRMMKSWVFSIMHWLFGATEFYILLLLLGVDIGFTSSLILEMGVTVIKNAGAFVPGQLGIEEIGNKVMLSVIGITSPLLWIVVSAFKRVRQLAWLLVGGLMYFISTFK